MKKGEVPGKIEVGSTIQIKLVFEHLVDGIRGCPIVRDLELGDLGLAGVASGVGSDMGGSTFGMDMFVSSFTHVEVLDVLDDFIGVDLGIVRDVITLQEL